MFEILRKIWLAFRKFVGDEPPDEVTPSPAANACTEDLVDHVDDIPVNIYGPTVKKNMIGSSGINLTHSGTAEIQARVVLGANPDFDFDAVELCIFLPDESNPLYVICSELMSIVKRVDGFNITGLIINIKDEVMLRYKSNERSAYIRVTLFKAGEDSIKIVSDLVRSDLGIPQFDRSAEIQEQIELDSNALRS